MQEELDRAKSGLKKTVAPEASKPKTLSMAELIAAQRNKLKKTVIAPKPPPEKKINPRDLLSQQIRLRFQNLKMHEKDDSDGSSSESD